MILYLLVTVYPTFALVDVLDERGGWVSLAILPLVAAWVGGQILVAMLGTSWEEVREKRRAAERRKQQEEEQRRRGEDTRGREAGHPGSKYFRDSYDRGGDYSGGSSGYSGFGGGGCGGGGGGD
ncbi:hypothetical protein ABZV91_20200 [Nocardia sp. NPDC004568]|uniref:hypothetical protein n=1 Tax=Nocardia sp. NPDC004568 TaxID=3154551 RepID=UPI0033B1F549